MHTPSLSYARLETGTMSARSAATADITAPALVERPVDQAVDGQLVYTFSEAIVLAPGASLSLTVRGQAPVTIALVNNPAVTLSGSTLTIQTPQRLAYATYHDVLFSAGAIADMAGNLAFGGEPFFHTFLSALSPVALKLTGTPGPDELRGSDLGDTIDGAGAADTILGYGGDDLLYGGSDADPAAPGADRLYGGDGNDGLRGGGGNDVLNGGNGNDQLHGEAGDDRLQGSDGDDLLDGGSGNDVLSGGEGVNILRGGEGNDRLSSHNASAIDLLDGGNGDDALDGYAGSEFLGGAGNDRIKVEGRLGPGGATRVEGGDGQDQIILSLSDTLIRSMTVTGGAGIDTYVPSTSKRSIATQAAITDFTPGPGGDLIDTRSMTIGSTVRNPFDDGSLRLLASGADTLFQLRDTTGAYSTVLTLAGVAPAQVVQENFVDAYNPRGGTTGYTLTGTAASDSLDGSIFDDTLLGLAGNDSLGGGLGNDLLEGGDGDDQLAGGGGDDTLRGGDGNDTLSEGYSTTSSDLFEGGGGNDRLTSEGGNDRLSGGTGDDVLTLRQDTTVATRYGVTMSGDAGNDTIVIFGTSRPVDVIASGGEGADVFEIGYYAEGAAITILDFGAQDVLDLRKWLPNGFTGNPAEAGYLRAVQQGADVAIQIDRDGLAGPGPAWTITLANVSLASLSPASFLGIFDPTGGSAGQSLSGTPGADVLRGGALDDTIDGGDGADRIEGGAGNDLLLGGDESLAGIGDIIWGGHGRDTLRGGAGNDQLVGGVGDDLLYGDAGDDVLEGHDGNDRLEGGDGNDTLIDDWGQDYLSGGAGDDVLDLSRSHSDRPPEATLDGGDGKDRLLGGSALKAVLGGAGDDEVTVSAGGNAGSTVQLSIELGDGNDLLLVRSLGVDGRPLRASGGAGIDTYQFGTSVNTGPLPTITDFRTGVGGDVLDVYALYNGNRSDNPFGPSGHARLVQDGNHVLLQVDPDGAVGALGWTARLLLENTRVADFTAANFTDNARPAAGSSGGTPGLVLTGTAAGDWIAGDALDDILRGGGGDDHIRGNGGADQLHGDDGVDFLFGGDGNDRLDGGEDRDILNGEAGDDELLGGSGNDTMEDRLGNNILRGGDGNDQIHTGGSGNAQVFGEAGDDLMFIAGGGRFDGGDGHDAFTVSLDIASTATLELSGGAGRDGYYLATAAPGATLTITDFKAGFDGDLIDIDKLLKTPFGNPFAAGGSLQFVQRGADAVLQVRAATDGADAFQDVLVLAGVQKSALTDDNIVLDFDPQGGSYGMSKAGGGAADQLAGTVHEDTLRGGAGNDLLIGGGGYDVLDGGTGIDTAVFSGTRSQYTLERVAQDPQDMVVSDLRPGLNEGRDRLLGIERLVFSDGALALDTGAEGVAGQAYRIYRAAFDRPADAGGLGFWIAMMDGGSTLAEIAGGFVRSQEFIDQYGAAPTNAELVTKLYRNILDRDPEQAGYAFWLDALDRKLVDLPSLLAQFSESNENRLALAELIANGVSYQPYGA